MNNPSIAIVDPNTLAVLGLTHLLKSVMPMIGIDQYSSFAELEGNHPERYFHYFVDMRIVLSHMPFFMEQRHKTIVLSSSVDNVGSQLGSFHTICTNQPEKMLLRSILMLEQHAHANGRNLPPMPTSNNDATLTQRETEVLTLVVKGYINKQIADKLSLSLPTIISHRKNMMDKLNIHSVSALTVYAVMHGYVDVNDI